MISMYKANTMAPHATPRFTLLLLSLCLALMPFGLQAQDIIRLTGKVLQKGNNEPLMGVNITDANTRRALATTDLDGRFAFNVHTGSTLKFSMIGMKARTVKVTGKNYIEVELQEDNVNLGEIVVQTKRITDRIMPEPTDIEVKGNYFYVRTRVRVPREMFRHNTRLVVQPILNNATRGQLKLMRPMVYDASEYHATQDRLYNFNMADTVAGDPLAQYVTVKSKAMREKGRTNDIIGYTDSIYVEHVKDEFSCDVYMAIENYNRILYRDTTIIARGTVNPLRWLDYNFGAREITDPAFIPSPEKQMRDSKGEVKLRFNVGKWTLNAADPQNAAEIEKLRQQIDLIAQQKDATLQNLSMEGWSSPEGKYKWNLTLAQRRMNNALGYMKQAVPEHMRQGMTFNANAHVAPWSEVGRLLRADGHEAEAQQVDNIVSRYKDHMQQGRAIQRLPFYTRLIHNVCLPQLRKVEYVMNYVIFRQLTPEEIEQMYEKDYRQLTRFEFFELYRAQTDAARRETIMQQALEVYPSFLAAANDLEAARINRQASDPDLLRPFAGPRAPQELNMNQIIALLNAGQYAQADSLTAYLQDTPDTHLLLAVNAVMNGRLDEHFNTVARTGLRNEVVMLLAMKRDAEAFKLSKQLPENEATSYYIRAICLNRLGDPVEAYNALKQAFAMNPDLKNIAKVDGDVCDLLVDDNKKH